MSEIKIGDHVLIKAQIIETRESAKGKFCRVKINNKICYIDEINVDIENIISQ